MASLHDNRTNDEDNPIDWLVQSFHGVMSGGGGQQSHKGVGHPFFQSLQEAAPWLGGSSGAPAALQGRIHPGLIEGAFEQAGGPAASPAREGGWEDEYEENGEDEENGENEEDYEFDDDDFDSQYNEEMWGDHLGDTEFSRLKDKSGNLIPYPTDSWVQDKKRSFQHLHHEVAADKIAKRPVVSTLEHGLFRKPREHPGWFPGGRFLFAMGREETIEDMQDRENYQARKSRSRAREQDEEDKREKANQMRMRFSGSLPRDFHRKAEAAQIIVKHKMEGLALLQEEGLLKIVHDRETLLERSKRQLISNLDDFQFGKGRRLKNIQAMCDERERVINFLADSQGQFFLGPTVVLKTEGNRFGVVPKEAAKI